MRPCLGSDLDATPLGLSHQRYPFLGRHMAYMQPCTLLFGKLDIALYLTPFTLGANPPMAMLARILAIVDIAASKQRVDLAMGGYQ